MKVMWYDQKFQNSYKNWNLNIWLTDCVGLKHMWTCSHTRTPTEVETKCVNVLHPAAQRNVGRVYLYVHQELAGFVLQSG